jgi:hypothetical protein
MRIRFFSDHMGLSTACILVCLALTGCGGTPINGCNIQSINVAPSAATVDHTATSPGNTQQFAAFAASVPQGCAVAQSNLTTVTWSVSDPVNVSIGATSGPSFGLATCKAATSGAVKVTGTLNQTDFAPVIATASLTCN